MGVQLQAQLQTILIHPTLHIRGSDVFKVTVIDEHENRSVPVSVTVTTVARPALSDITYSSPGPLSWRSSNWSTNHNHRHF